MLCQGLSLPSATAGDKKKEGGGELGGRGLMGNRKVWRLGLEGRWGKRGELCGESRAACRWGLGEMLPHLVEEVMKKQ